MKIEIHNFKVSFVTKFTTSKSHFKQNSRFKNLNFHKIHFSEISSFAKFTFFETLVKIELEPKGEPSFFLLQQKLVSQSPAFYSECDTFDPTLVHIDNINEN